MTERSVKFRASGGPVMIGCAAVFIVLSLIFAAAVKLLFFM